MFRWVRCALERPSGQQEQPEALDLAVFIEPFFFFNCIEIQLVYHIVLVSGVQKVIQLYIHTYIYIGEGHGNPFQYSCLENPLDRGAWQAVVHRVAKSWTRLKRLSIHTSVCVCVYSF